MIQEDEGYQPTFRHFIKEAVIDHREDSPIRLPVKNPRRIAHIQTVKSAKVIRRRKASKAARKSRKKS